MLVKQEANYIRSGRGKAVILLYRKHQVRLLGNRHLLGRTSARIECQGRLFLVRFCYLFGSGQVE